MTPRRFIRSRASLTSVLLLSIESTAPPRSAMNIPASSAGCTPYATTGTVPPSPPATTNSLKKELGTAITDIAAFKNASATEAVKAANVASDASTLPRVTTSQEASALLTFTSSGSAANTAAKLDHEENWTAFMSDLEARYDPDDAYLVLDVLWDNKRHALLAREFPVERIVEEFFSEKEVKSKNGYDRVNGPLGYLVDGHLVGPLLWEVGRAYDGWKARA
ncbi:hypothetical protein BC830DRAFT_705587 [Chytriomyces sp. MP71]|nr:hypothetical protein BC830DRAFT_705587 [Chytriomyces sp. MP71]